MKLSYFYVCIIALYIHPLFSSSTEKISDKYNPISNEKSKITVTGSAKITIINDRYDSYGPRAKELVEERGGKINYVIMDNEDAQLSRSEDYSNTTTIPQEFIVERVFPNPFNPTVNIKYGLPKEGLVRIVIYDIQGKEINRLSLHNQSAGWYNFVWNGTNSIGQAVGTGVYLFTIQVGDLIKHKKITYLK